MATALNKQDTLDFRQNALQLKQLKDPNGNAVDVADLVLVAGGGAGAAVVATSVTAGDASLGIDGITAAQGGAVVVTGGTSSTSTNAGGAVSVTGGIGTTTAVGGAASVVGGAGAGASAGGAALVTGGLGGATNAVGGAATVTSGAGQGTGNGGVASVVGGTSGVGGATGRGGNALVTGGASVATNGSGGGVILTGGALAGTGKKGSVIARGQNFAQSQVAPTAKTVTAAITAAELATGIITTTGATAPSVHQLPTGTLLLAEFPDFAANDSFDFHVINTGTGASDDATITVNTDITIVGNPTVGSLTDGTIISGSGHFRARYTTGVTWVVYRLA